MWSSFRGAVVQITPERPTISIYSVMDGRYRLTQFLGDERDVSLSFEDLGLSAAEICSIRA